MPTSCGLWKTNESLPPLRGRDFFLRGRIGYVWGGGYGTKISMEQGWLLCRETGGRAELTMEVPGGSRGLYRGYVLGERGLMDLGTLLPEGNVLRLRRTFPVERLRSQGCWPVTGGRVQMTYAFTGQPRCCSAPGLEGTGPSGDPVSPGPGAGPGGPGRGAGDALPAAG